MRVFPLSQLTATVFALLALYQFLLFWINGVAGVSAPVDRLLGPCAFRERIIWPILSMFLSGHALSLAVSRPGVSHGPALLSPIKDHPLRTAPVSRSRVILTGRRFAIVADSVVVVARLVQLQVVEYEHFAEKLTGKPRYA